MRPLPGVRALVPVEVAGVAEGAAAGGADKGQLLVVQPQVVREVAQREERLEADVARVGAHLLVRATLVRV